MCKCATGPTGATGAPTGAIYNVRSTHRPSGRPTGPRRTALYPNDPEAHIQLIQYVSRRPYIVYSAGGCAGGAGGTFTHTRSQVPFISIETLHRQATAISIASVNVLAVVQ